MDDNVFVTEDKSVRISKQLNNWRRCRKPKDLKTLEKRIDLYFERCTELSLLPSLETMSLSLGVNRSTVWRWSVGSGCSQEWTDLIQRAIATIESYLDVAGSTNSVNPVTLIWRQKSMYGRSDAPGQSERERAVRQTVVNASYVLPGRILEMYALPDDNSRTEALTTSQTASEKEYSLPNTDGKDDAPRAVRELYTFSYDSFEPTPDDYDEDNVPFT